MFISTAPRRTRLVRRRRFLGDTLTLEDYMRAASGGALVGPAYLWCKYNAPQGAGADCEAAFTDVAANVQGNVGPGQAGAILRQTQDDIAHAGQDVPLDVVRQQQNQAAADARAAAAQTNTPNPVVAGLVPLLLIGGVLWMGVTIATN